MKIKIQSNPPVELADWIDEEWRAQGPRKTARGIASLLIILYRRGEISLGELYFCVTNETLPENITFEELPDLGITHI